MKKGYAVGFHMCINPTNESQAIHVNKGDNLTITAHVSVDPTDTRSLPIPGGEHHGFMHLFYFVLHPDSEEDAYSCKNDICVPQPGGVLRFVVIVLRQALQPPERDQMMAPVPSNT